jgi:ATP-dependent helicase YprA (DUF1998 family)
MPRQEQQEASGRAPLDLERFATAARKLCAVFNIPSLHLFQEQAGKHVLEGRSVILDVPTGGGKTLAFILPLF